MYRPVEILVEREAREYPLTGEILARFKNIPVKEIEYRENCIPENLSPAESFLWAKRRLALAVLKGETSRLFRCLPGLVGREEYHLYANHGCPADCEYCYLQEYLESPLPMIFVNQEEILTKLRVSLNEHPRAFYHAGVTSDPLAFEEQSGFCRNLLALFAEFPECKIEIRTKYPGADKFYESFSTLPKNLIPAWTLTPENAIREFERGTASVGERLSAASIAASRGARIGLRLDPLINYPTWEEDYRELVNEICRTLQPEQIETVVMGAFRFSPPLKENVFARRPNCSLFSGELIPGRDGKMRYSKPVRIEMYRKIVEYIRSHWTNFRRIVLSMEGPEVWSAAQL